LGREAVCLCRWRGEKAEARVLLESQEIILRGNLKARIRRDVIAKVAVEGGDLLIMLVREKLVLELGSAEAGKWAAALLKAPPTLAEKLGISGSKPAFVIGATSDAELLAALKDATVSSARDAAVLIGILNAEADLKKAFKIAIKIPDLKIWCVHGKGKSATLGDTAIRTFMRTNGYLDTKTCAVSSTLTATRYGAKQ
jgi:hypothetical protein